MGQFISAPSSLSNDGGGVAYFAHIGGFLAGLIITMIMKRLNFLSLSITESIPWETRKTRKEDFKYILTHNVQSSVPSFHRRKKGSVPVSKRKTK